MCKLQYPALISLIIKLYEIINTATSTDAITVVNFKISAA